MTISYDNFDENFWWQYWQHVIDNWDNFCQFWQFWKDSPGKLWLFTYYYLLISDLWGSPHILAVGVEWALIHLSHIRRTFDHAKKRISRQLSDIICQLGQLSARTTVSSDICQLGHLSARTSVSPDNCQNPKDNCQIKLSELWKNCQSYGKTVSSDSCPLKTVRPDSCPPKLFC